MLRRRVPASRNSNGTDSDERPGRTDSPSNPPSQPTIPSIPSSQIPIISPPTPSEPQVRVAPIPTHPQLLHLLKVQEASGQPRIPDRYRPLKSRDASPSAYTLWKLARLPSTDSQSLDHPPTPIRPSSSPDPPDAHHHQYIPPGAYRPLTFRNVGLAITILRQSTFALFTMLWTNIHPVRIVLFLLLNFIRGLFPAVRSFSQSLLLDQVHSAVKDQVVSSRLAWLLALEVGRMLVEAVFEHYASANERIVQQTIRFQVEYVQMETRLRLDIPSLQNPTIQDLLQESDQFARSFNGMGGAFGLLSPFDLVRSLTTLGTEIIGQSFVLYTLLFKENHGSWTPQQIGLIGLALAPSVLSCLNWLWTKTCFGEGEFDDENSQWPHTLYSAEEADTAERHERMRRLAYDESFKSEIMLFGLGKWILKTWVDTRQLLLNAENRQGNRSPYRSTRQPRLGPRTIFGVVETPVAIEFARDSMRELMLTLQAIPLILQISATSLGNATLYRTSIQTIIASVQTLGRTFQLTYQSIFLMGAFHAALTLQPSMEPAPENRVAYQVALNPDGKRRGMKIEARNLWFTYPGESEPVILKENAGIGAVDKMDDDEEVEEALRNGGAWGFVQSLHDGMNTRLEAGGFGGGGGIGGRAYRSRDSQSPPLLGRPRRQHKVALSGGQWQRIALSRSFMRADSDLLVLDEASSQLDAHAQNEVFRRLLAPEVRGKRTVIYITHRMSTVRWADKVAFFDEGKVKEFGTHQELMDLQGGGYRDLYNAFVNAGTGSGLSSDEA
ncbi:hypothetical protein M407DRAFT_78312 [Tulasnella calospora MUT 4182]|uniref:ABC transporter domain-containing protein n=1 Tax=Tulasnella calospora MUT 4182 TaxID=1051891 RepID=A0A0C3QE43_9AGAM|nr:hypothetical protein M407DRAFT_78312 [Tulasnella calospora MUT 4182]